MMTCGCGSRAADYLGWTAGNRADAEKMAKEVAADHGCVVEIIPCAAYGYDVVRAA